MIKKAKISRALKINQFKEIYIKGVSPPEYACFRTKYKLKKTTLLRSVKELSFYVFVLDFDNPSILLNTTNT